MTEEEKNEMDRENHGLSGLIVSIIAAITMIATPTLSLLIAIIAVALSRRQLKNCESAKARAGLAIGIVTIVTSAFLTLLGIISVMILLTIL